MNSSKTRSLVAPAGYSGKPLIEKLGIKENMTALVISPPKNFLMLLGSLPKGVAMKNRRTGLFDFIHFFTRELSELQDEFPKLAKSLAPKGMIWISWPKGSSGIETDVSENRIREVGLKTGLVDVKVAAIDETWSGLKFLRRKI